MQRKVRHFVRESSGQCAGVKIYEL